MQPHPQPVHSHTNEDTQASPTPRHVPWGWWVTWGLLLLPCIFGLKYVWPHASGNALAAWSFLFSGLFCAGLYFIGRAFRWVIAMAAGILPGPS